MPEETKLTSQFCPECGAGTISNLDGIVTFRLPKGYPYESPCKTCSKRSDYKMRELGKAAAEEVERRIFDTMLRT